MADLAEGTGTGAAADVFASLFGGSPEELADEATALASIASDEPKTTVGDEGLEAALFQEEHADDEDLREVKAEGAEPDDVPYKRVAKLVSQRNEAREQLAEEKSARKAAEARVTELQTATVGLESIKKAYGEVKGDLVTNVLEDARFMSSVQALKDSPDVKQFIAKILTHMKTGKAGAQVSTSETTTSTTTQQQQETRPNATGDRAMRFLATEVVDTLLEKANVRPELRGTIAKDVITRLNLDTFDRASALEAIRGVIKENGWSREFITSQPDSGKDTKPSVTGSGGGASIQEQKAQASATGDTGKLKASDFKNIEQFRDVVRGRFGEFVNAELAKQV